VHTVTSEHIEEEDRIVYKRLLRIPLIYVRDVTHSQNFLQAVFDVSSITVSLTNGDNIVLYSFLQRKGEIRRERPSGSRRCRDARRADDALVF
jgi:hypothetical protein